jgi:hypothetical protein
MKKLFVLGVVLTLLAASASAQRTGDRIRNHRIERGFDNGQLTRSERARLHRNETRLRFEKRRALRDGRITPRERRRIAKMQRHERREIFRLKHNGRRRLI